MGNLEYLIYPDGSEVYYCYDVNNNLVSATDWAGRVTTYTYDENNRVIGVTKPDGSTTTTVYDDKQRIVSTVEKTASNVIISGFEYEYDVIGRIAGETDLAKNIKLCYTYDEQSRVIKRTMEYLAGTTVTDEEFTYDAAGNITEDNSFNYVYDTNNRLTEYKGNSVTYDLDGNMLSNGTLSCAYDSGNRLISAGGHTYTYNAENVRIRNLCTDADTTYVYNTNCKLSQLLMKTTNGIVTKYVYGLGLIGEEKQGCFKTYHFDYRGSTVAITDANGNFTDTFTYDTYGKLTARTGTSFVIFGYNGRDGVVTDKNGLIYMRARYYSPELRRFINADVVAGSLDNSVTLNRFAYANGNPASFIDPFGLWGLEGIWNDFINWANEKVVTPVSNWAKETFKKIENSLLHIESKYIKYDYSFENNAYISDYTGGLIEDQDDMLQFYLGDSSIADVGCEVVAVYNAMVLMGYKELSFLDVIKSFEDQGALVGQSFLTGSFGSNPFAIPRVLNEKGLSYSTISGFEDLSESGTYIISFWNSNNLDSMIHTIAVKVDGNGELHGINGQIKEQDQKFITGYKIRQK